MLPIKRLHTAKHSDTPSNALRIEPAQGTGILPTLTVDMPSRAATALRLLLQVHNSAGIPIITAQASLAIGERRVVFADLQPIGMEAYAHKPPAEQAQIAQRIWTRRAYAMIVIQDDQP